MLDDIDMNLIDENFALQTCNRDKNKDNREENKENENYENEVELVSFLNPPAPGFSDRLKELKYKSPLARRRGVGGETTPVRPKLSSSSLETTPLLRGHPPPPSPLCNLPARSAPDILSDSELLLSSFYGTPFKSTQQKLLYSTGIMSPYTPRSSETVRLGVPLEVFRLIEKIRGEGVGGCPTSGGKTLVGELLLLNALLTRCTDALLILPYVALVEEIVHFLDFLSSHFDNGLERYAGSRGKLPPRKRRGKKTIYVATDNQM
eukprot:sb/3479737/